MMYRVREICYPEKIVMNDRIMITGTVRGDGR